MSNFDNIELQLYELQNITNIKLDEEISVEIRASLLEETILRRMFSKIDANNTGTIEFDELKEAFEKDTELNKTFNLLQYEKRYREKKIEPNILTIEEIFNNMKSKHMSTINFHEFISFFNNQDKIFGDLHGTELEHLISIAHWSYSGENGPPFWGSLSQKNILADLGKNQSPIDIFTDSVEDKSSSDEYKLIIEYGSLGLDSKITNNGHSIQVDANCDNHQVFIVITNKDQSQQFRLLQFHFHSPSEHTINGKRYPLELHLVHINDENQLAVIGILFKLGADNDFLKLIVDRLPKNEGESFKLDDIDLDLSLLDIKDKHYRYSGSLTTPPCSENVEWNIMKHVKTVSPNFISKFKQAISFNNQRPTCDINDRQVTLF